MLAWCFNNSIFSIEWIQIYCEKKKQRRYVPVKIKETKHIFEDDLCLVERWEILWNFCAFFFWCMVIRWVVNRIWSWRVAKNITCLVGWWMIKSQLECVIGKSSVLNLVKLDTCGAWMYFNCMWNYI